MRSHFLQSVLGLTVLGAALVACGDDSADGAGGGSGGSSSATEATTGTSPTTATGNAPTTTTTTTGSAPTTTTGSASPTSSTTASSSPTTNTTTTSSGPGCSVTDFFTDPDVNECVGATCCDELVICDANPELCFNLDDGTFDTTLPDGFNLYECAYLSSCFGASVCDSGIGFGAPGDEIDEATLEYAFCLDQNCCEEMNFCTDDGVDGESCISCLNGEADTYELCEPVNNCAIENCEQGLIFVPICNSGLGTGDLEGGTCANDNCCDEYVACTGGEDDMEGIQACLDCLIDGGGPLCDDAILCEEEFCSTAVCDSGIAYSDIETAACLTANCCTEYTDCTGGDPEDEEAVQACLDCFNEEGGALCDDAIACTDEFCGDGGTGGGGTGGGGTGGNG